MTERRAELSSRAGEPGGERRGPVYARALLAELPEAIGGVREIAAALRLDLREVTADSFDGALIRVRDLPLGSVVVRESIREVSRKNFTIAHEIGHFVLPGHEHASVACTASEVGDWADSSSDHAIEREANEFAAELLMPTGLVEAITASAAPSLSVIEKIARKFGTSLSAAAWRYCDVAIERCAVVWSTEGRVQWVKRSPGFRYFVPSDKPIEAGSFAAACFAGKKVPRHPRAVPSDLWLRRVSVDPSLTLLEQSKALPAYGSVISLLWVKEGHSAMRGVR